ncbi:DUF4190 domain-containing protein [Nocardia sp. SYP-A9097]|uniref:DUF4190 domain-containing protein n=1 Tax=Nocardia sp. SYP-A9097 TaxID=2663237 RepID=UPI00129A3874|nr:DUF4190 domain-containing protein [Nocardia sp. SYP-A9097]MRH89517.1 DUF4190 domain-containing protein [Nocardia sp. SYP-A9097]
MDPTPEHPNTPDKPVELGKPAGSEQLQPGQQAVPDPTMVAWSPGQPYGADPGQQSVPGQPAWGQQGVPGQQGWGQPAADQQAWGQQSAPGQQAWGQPDPQGTGGQWPQPEGAAPYGAQPSYQGAAPYPGDPAYGTSYPQPAPYPGAPGYPAAPYPGPPQGTNGFAIAALITGLLGMCLLSVPFGVIGLSQIKDRNQQGKGLAITGLVLTAVWAVVGVVLFAVGVTNTKDTDTDSFSPPSVNFTPPSVNFSTPSLPTTTASPGGYTLLRNLKDGDCVNGVHRKTSISGATVTSCSGPHDAEVFLNFSLPNWTGDQQSKDFAETKCAEVFDRIDAKKAGLSYLYYRPHSQSEWNSDPTVQCIAINDDETKLTSKLPR